MSTEDKINLTFEIARPQVENLSAAGHERECALAILSQAIHGRALDDIQVLHLLAIGYRAGWREARRDGREPELATTPRVWAMPPEPGPEVTRVRDVYGQGFSRAEAYDVEGPPEQGWLGDAFTDEADVPDLFLTWKQLMKEHEPLTDVTSEVVEESTP